jgi:hypothetical protein
MLVCMGVTDDAPDLIVGLSAEDLINLLVRGEVASTAEAFGHPQGVLRVVFAPTDRMLAAPIIERYPKLKEPIEAAFKRHEESGKPEVVWTLADPPVRPFETASE